MSDTIDREALRRTARRLRELRRMAHDDGLNAAEEREANAHMDLAIDALGPLLDALDAAEGARDALRAWVRSAMQGWDLGDEMLAQGRALLGEEE